MSIIYENHLVKIEIHESEIPWLKIFTHTKHKEFSHASSEEKAEIWRLLEIIEKEMLIFFNPTKINIASFGNYLPHLHWHIMARFESDSYFPEPMWGTIQKKGTYKLKDMDRFIASLVEKLNA